MVTTAQNMAVKRIEQLVLKTQDRCDRGVHLDPIAEQFEKDLKEVTNLVKEHGLDKQLAESFYERVVKSILAHAEKEALFAWAANFAKKYMKE